MRIGLDDKEQTMSTVHSISLGAHTTVGASWQKQEPIAAVMPVPRSNSVVDLPLVRDPETLNLRSNFNTAVSQQLAKILQSKVFIQSNKLSRFLGFVVEHVLDGNPSCLKEYLIGVEVYDRKPPYDPSQDSIVRTEARRLRSKLKEYFETEGREDPIHVYMRVGSYVPVFQSREDLIGVPSITEPETLLQPSPSSIVTAIFPFRHLSEDSVSSVYSRGIQDELAYALMQNDGCQVVSPSLLTFDTLQEYDLVSKMRSVGAILAYEGSVRVEESGAGVRVRVTARIVNASGIQLWVKRIDVEAKAESSFTTEEQIGLSLSFGLNIVQTSSPNLLQNCKSRLAGQAQD